MIKKIFLEVLLIIFTFVGPFYFLNLYEDSVIITKKIQIPILLVMLLGSFILVFVNYQYKKQVPKSKLLWFVFLALGILGIVLSVGVVFLIFFFRKGIGF